MRAFRRAEGALPGEKAGGWGRCRTCLRSVWWDRGVKPLVQLFTRHVAEYAAF